eukprot:gene18734-15757_t
MFSLARSMNTGVARMASRSIHAAVPVQMKVLAALYEDPQQGYPPQYARDDIPHIEVYPDGQTLPTPESEGPKPGTLLGCVSGELGLREFLESRGHELVVVNDKD